MRQAGPGLKVKFNPRPEDLAAARELGKSLAQKIKEQRPLEHVNA
jgi:hypothetical protein